jgi:hypothetical protein
MRASWLNFSASTSSPRSGFRISRRAPVDSCFAVGRSSCASAPSLKNRIHGHLISENLVSPGADLYGKGGRAWLAAAPLSRVLRAQPERLLTLHDALSVEIQGLDGDVRRAKGNPTVKQVTTRPGVGVFRALCVQAEIGSIDRCHSSHELAASAGRVPTTRSSGGKTTHGGLGKASNRWLKWILVEIVVPLKLAPGPVGPYDRHLRRAKGKPKAQTAAARKLCCDLYRMLKHGWTYDEWLQQHGTSQRSEVRPVHRVGAMASQHRVIPPVTRLGHLLRLQARVFSGRRGA